MSVKTAPLRVGNFRERSADMNRAGPVTRGRAPRHGGVKRPIHLEHAGSVAISLEPSPISARHAIAGEANQLPRTNVAHHCARRRKLRQGFHRCGGDDLASKGSQIHRQRIRHPLRSASRERPANRVRRHHQSQRVTAGRELFERHHAVRGRTGQ